MWMQMVGLVISLVIILISCEVFTNGIEWLGKRLKMGDGVVGSLFSAVGTCLPETAIPVIALLTVKDSKSSVDIGVGAIMGAPFMLSTLAFFLTGASVLIFWKKRKTGMKMQVNNQILSRDIGFFIVVYTIGSLAAFNRYEAFKFFVALFLIFCYIVYIILTVRQDHTSHGNVEELYLTKYFNLKPKLRFILLQIVLALSGIVFGAQFFVQNIERSADLFGISALVLSVVITPIATELPEKFNSILWISKKKDTLAMGNITGAMVFQSCIPVSIGILATPWELDGKIVLSAILAITSALIVYIWIKIKGKLNPIPLLCGGIFYSLFIGYLVMNGFK